MPIEDERYRMMIESSQDWFWEFDENANFTYVSPVIRNLLGFEPEELIGLNAFDLMSPAEAERVRKHFDPIAKKYLPFKNLENVNIHKDGHEVVIESSGTPFFDEDGHFLGYRGIDRDITSRKQNEIELQTAKQKTEKAINVKNIFLANMSHELRTPVVGIKGFAELLKATELTQQQTELLTIISSSVEKLLILVDNILDSIKIEAEGLAISSEPFNLSQLIGQITSTQEHKVIQKGLIYKSKIPDDLPTFLLGDPVRIKQILINIFDNAIKFTESGTITFTISKKKKGKDKVVISFSLEDTGCGITKEKQDRIFEQFFQIEESMNRLFDGSGLGLSVCHHLAKMMGGNIHFESQKGVGSKFSLQLPSTLLAYYS
jgi:PAS domain S-box-containing protein